MRVNTRREISVQERDVETSRKGVQGMYEMRIDSQKA